MVDLVAVSAETAISAVSAVIGRGIVMLEGVADAAVGTKLWLSR